MPVIRGSEEIEMAHYTLIEPAKIGNKYHIERQRKLKVNQEVYDYPRDYINIYEVGYPSTFDTEYYIKKDWVPAVMFKDVNYSDLELLYKLENVGYLKRKKVSVALAEELSPQPTQPTQPIVVATPTITTTQTTVTTTPTTQTTITTTEPSTTTTTVSETSTDTFKKYLPYIIIVAIIVIILILFKRSD